MSDSSIAALKERNFLLFTIGSLIALIGRQMLTVAVGWDIYERTGSALALGAIGLAQFLPVLLLTLLAGHAVDVYNRRSVLILSQIGSVIATAGLAWISFVEGPIGWMYAFLVLAGVSRAYNSPANAALMPLIVSTQNFTNAVTWSSMVFQLASIAGPALGGAMIALNHAAWPVYFIDFIANLLFAVLLLFVHSRKQATPAHKSMSLNAMLSGVRFIKNTPIILAAITLDMFAVLFGGAIALLPIYAKDILHAGPEGLGWLQAAPSIGAIMAGFMLARMGPFRHAGTWLLWAVIGFGLTTIGFGLSKNFGFSFLLLFLAGAFDNISVVIRHALVQLRTPDEMRGRVSAINFVFIGTSNELGGFESGLVAHWLSPVFSVVFGGVATILTVIATSLIWPELRNLKKLEAYQEAEPEK